MASIGHSITGPRFHETDEWFDKQKAYLESLELQLRGRVKSIDLVSKQRTGKCQPNSVCARNRSLFPVFNSPTTGDVERPSKTLSSDKTWRDLFEPGVPVPHQANTPF